MVPVTKVLKDAGMTPKEIDEIVLVGGSTRIPKVDFLVNVTISCGQERKLPFSKTLFRQSLLHNYE